MAALAARGTLVPEREVLKETVVTWEKTLTTGRKFLLELLRGASLCGTDEMEMGVLFILRGIMSS
jgi:hypothetical protein